MKDFVKDFMEDFMNDFNAYLEKLDQEFSNYMDTINAYEKTQPDGYLKFSHPHPEKITYFHVGNDAARTKHYIRKEQMDFAQALAQKYYFQKVKKNLLPVYHAIKKLRKNYTPEMIDAIYESLPPARQILVKPLRLTRESYIEEWKRSHSSEEKCDFPFTGEILTERGEQVRSKSEKIIADQFFMQGIPYLYESALYLSPQYSNPVFPDFIVLNVRTRKEYILEHLGMMDDAEYAAKAIRKLALYEKNGFLQGRDLLLTYETSSCPLNMRILKGLIQAYLL